MTANWTQSYFYDRYGNKQGATAGGITANSQAVPSDGLTSQSYDSASNRINTSGYLYDLAGNLTKGQDASGNWQTYEYDQAGRMLRVRDASNNILETHFYAADRKRYGVENSTQRTFYAWGGASVLEEYTEPLAGNTPTYSKSYVYAGSRLLSTYTNNGGTETLQLQHPDRLGTKLVTNPQSATQFEQATLPFGTSLDAETTGTTNERFTSYDRSSVSGLDYAINRSYSSGQNRFTSVDPIGMSATKQTNPQSNNLYAYVQNNPIDNVDPSGLNLRMITGWQEWSFFTTDGEHKDVGPHFWMPYSYWYDDGVTSGGSEGGGGGTSTHETTDDVEKDYVRVFDCNKLAKDVFNKMRINFPNFANFVGTFGPLGIPASTAAVSFERKTITEGAEIQIHNVNTINDGSLDKQIVLDVSVKVSKVSTQVSTTMGFTFATNEGHVLHPATISFTASDFNQGKLKFEINVRGNFAGIPQEVGYYAGGNNLEDKIWNNVIDNVEKYCGNKKGK